MLEVLSGLTNKLSLQDNLNGKVQAEFNNTNYSPGCALAPIWFIWVRSQIERFIMSFTDQGKLLNPFDERGAQSIDID
jgi:hypothetical protein